MKPWLTIIGMDAGGATDLAPATAQELSDCEIIFGSERLVRRSALPAEKCRLWPSPFRDAIDQLKSLRGQKVAVLATGDPMHFGVGATLSNYFSSAETTVIPASSAFSLAAARLGWPLQDVAKISLHGRPAENLVAVLQPGRRIIALTSNGDRVREIAAILSGHGYGASRVMVFEDMGTGDERINSFLTTDIGAHRFSDLNTVAIECSSAPEAWPRTNVAGLPNDYFKHDGQLTKREVRAVTQAALAPARGELLWDVGAGCGSVAIEWMRAIGGARAIAFEHNENRLSMISENALALGTPSLEIISGSAPAAFDGHPAPDAVFVGGGVSDEKLMNAAWDALKAGGRFVANAVTLPGETALVTRHATFGGELVRIDISVAEPIGLTSAMTPRMPVLQWRATKDTAP